MKISRNISVMACLLLILTITSCSSSSEMNKEIAGKYASSSENNYDYFKDTIEVKPTDDGKFDIQTIANWSAAKKDDPQRPNKNKKAGVWNNYGMGEIETATLQASDKTLRITDPMTGTVKVLTVDLEKKTIEEVFKDRTKTIYHKVK
ncbi:hypothetical protein [Pedobacter gandavensis]|uniref:Lipocalin-like domain-containing protein n=1 Tax=Pedobacter gandavensis TaxID=2679963 RepID=A0ABR6EVF8_9SPHI|nr:hypothetical protein [Pedobacter gandavensis]MBB2148936.1 hypothetical protein [Pedobacter gandavensis]